MSQAPQPEQKPAPLKSERVHRREVFVQIILPLAAGIGGFALLMVLLFLVPRVLPQANQIAMLADTLAILSLLIPAILCILPLYVLMVLLVHWMGQLNKGTATQLRRVHRLTETVTDGTIHATESINRRTADWRVRVAGAEHFMDNAFNPGQDGTENTTQHDGTEPTNTA